MQARRDIWIIGFGIFAMVFGAGNLIFPPLLGANTGSYWWIAACAFVLSDAIFALITIIVLSRFGSLDAFGEKLGKTFFKFYSIIAILVFAFFALPRTGSTTYEISFQPFLPTDFNSWYFYIVYFVLALVLTIKPSKVFDSVGKIFGPLLVICVALIVISGLLFLENNPRVITVSKGEVFKEGFLAGYQTMGMLGCLFQASFAITVLSLKGYNTTEQRHYMLFRCAMFAMILLMLIYFALTYLGSLIGAEIPANSTAISALQYISQKALGVWGTYLLAFSVFIACFSTTVGILGIVSDFMTFFFKKTTYKQWAIFFTLTSLFIAKQGVDFIIVIALPALQAVYPLLVFIVLLHVINVQKHQVFKITCYTTLIFSILDVMATLKMQWAMDIVHMLPLGSLGFVWFIPSLIAMGIAFMIPFENNLKASS